MKLKYLLPLLLLFTAPAYADRYLVEAKIGHFRPFSEELRSIYSDGWANYQLEISYSPWNWSDCCWWENFFVWGGYNFLYDKGSTRSGIDDDESEIQLYNFTLGLKYFQDLPCCAKAYAGAGLRYFFLRIENKDETVDRRERAAGLGGVFNFGLVFNPWRRLLVDFYTDVPIKRFRESEFTKQNDEIAESIDVSGITFGIGVGIYF